MEDILSVGRTVIQLAFLSAAVACSDSSPPSPPVPTAAEVADAQAAEQFKSLPIFTLSCEGRYSWTSEGKTNSGSQSFSITVAPARGVVYMFGFDADGFLDRTHRAMNNELRQISRVTLSHVHAGELSLDRNTGKYKYGETTAGMCKKDPQHTPIPGQQF